LTVVTTAARVMSEPIWVVFATKSDDRAKMGMTNAASSYLDDLVIGEV
jgi:hypothetical protein